MIVAKKRKIIPIILIDILYNSTSQGIVTRPWMLDCNLQRDVWNERKITMSNVNTFGKAILDHKREPHPPRQRTLTRRWAFNGVVCNLAAGAALFFVAALVFGLIGH